MAPDVSWGAIVAIAGTEWRRRWRGIVAVGLLAGLAGGALVTGAATVRRTASAPDRLMEVVAPGDVRLQVFAPDLVDQLQDLPSVDELRRGRLAVARVETAEVVYMGTFLPEQDQGRLMQPAVVAGRAPVADDEVLLVEEAAAALGVGPGDELRLAYLTPEEVGQFDTGFGEPDGPHLSVTVTGVGRVPSGVLSGTPMVGSAALGDQIAATAAGWDVYVDLGHGAGARPAFEAALDDVLASVPPTPGAEEFPPILTSDPTEGTRDGVRSTRVIVAGMAAALAVAALSMLVVAWQALSRHHVASAADQQVEAALGLTAGERAAARVLPLVPAAALAMAVAGVVAVAGGVLEPPGSVGRLEPDPGWRLDVPVLVVGVAVVGAALLFVGDRTARRAGGPADAAPGRNRVVRWRLVPRRGAWPLVGTTFAVGAGQPGGRVSARASLVGSIVGVGGVVACLTFGASLDRLVDEPVRWGWNADLSVVDVTDEIVAELADDPRVAAVTEVGSASVAIDGTTYSGYSIGARTDVLPWTLLEGRAPRGDTEVVLGTRVSELLDAGVGDHVDIGGREMEVVGVGLGPLLDGEQLGRAVLLRDEALAAVGATQPFREAFVVAAPGVDTAALAEDVGARYEISRREPPRPVRDLADLDSLPDVLAVFVAAVALIALLHGLSVGTRVRRRELAMLRALGAERRHLRLAVVASAAVTVAVAVVVGVPLGWAVARLAWGEVARGTGVDDDLLVPWSVPLAVAAALVLVPLVALVPARAAVRTRPGSILRQE